MLGVAKDERLKLRELWWGKCSACFSIFTTPIEVVDELYARGEQEYVPSVLSRCPYCLAAVLVFRKGTAIANRIFLESQSPSPNA